MQWSLPCWLVSHVLFNHVTKLLWVGTLKPVDDLAALEKEKGRHGTDTVLGGRIRRFVDVHLQENDRIVLFTHFLVKRGNG